MNGFMKKRFAVVLFFGLIFGLFTSCGQLVAENQAGTSISVKLPYHGEDRAAVNAESFFYKITCEAFNGSYNREKTAFSGDEIVFGDLDAGKYKVSVIAYYNEKLRIELYSGSEVVELQVGEGKSVNITLKYSGPKTDLPLELYSFQDRNNCARINLTGQKVRVEISKDCPVTPVYYYWYGEEGVYEKYCGPDKTGFDSLPAELGDGESVGVIVKFEDGSYAIRSYLLDSLIETDCVNECEYTKNAVGKSKLSFSFTYPNISGTNGIETFIVPIDSILQNEDLEFMEFQQDGEPVNGKYKSPASFEVNTTTEKFTVELEEGWYVVNTALIMFNDGYGSSNDPMSYLFQNAVYIKEGYNLNYESVFPFAEFYDNYWYKIEWDLNGGSWPDGFEPSEYILRDYPKGEEDKSVIKFQIPNPSFSYDYFTVEGFTVSDNVTDSVITKNPDGTYTVSLHEPKAYNQKIKITAVWGATVSDFEQLKEAAESASIKNIYIDNGEYLFTETININHNEYLFRVGDECCFGRSEEFNQEMFNIRSDGINEITVEIEGLDDGSLVYFEDLGEFGYEKSIFVIDDSKTTLNLTYCSFNSIISKQDGAVVNCIDGTVNVSGCQFIGCSLESNGDEGKKGGAIYVNDGTLKIRNNCKFKSNSSEMGGAVYIEGSASELTVSDSVEFTSNEANSRGGAIYTIGGNVKIADSLFNENTVSDRGGAVYCEGNTIVISDSIFESNESGIYGGAVHGEGSNLIIKNSSFYKCMADSDGGAICAAIQGGQEFRLSATEFGTDDEANMGGDTDSSPNCKLFTASTYDNIFIDDAIRNQFGITELYTDLQF